MVTFLIPWMNSCNWSPTREVQLKARQDQVLRKTSASLNISKLIHIQQRQISKGRLKESCLLLLSLMVELLYATILLSRSQQTTSPFERTFNPILHLICWNNNKWRKPVKKAPFRAWSEDSITSAGYTLYTSSYVLPSVRVGSLLRHRNQRTDFS